MESVSAYFLTTDKAIVTKLDQTFKEIELCRIWGERDVTFKILGPLHISETVEARNFNFGMQIGH